MIHAGRWLLLAALALQDDPIAAEALKGYRHPWADFGNGCSVLMKETFRRPDIDANGKLIYRDVVNEVSWTVVAQAGEKSTFKIEGGGQESMLPYFITFPNWARGKGEKKGSEELTVGGKKRTCEVTTISLDVDKDAGQMTTISKCAELPYWAVRWRVETFLKGKVNTSEEEVLLELDQKVKVGEREISCALVQSTVDVVGGVRTVKKEWRADEVPGRVVRRESRQFLNGKELESGLTQMEVVRFNIKR